MAQLSIHALRAARNAAEMRFNKQLLLVVFGALQWLSCARTDLGEPGVGASRVPNAADEPARTTSTLRAASPDAGATLHAPARGRWRLAPFQDFLRASLELSHLLIRHRDAPRDQVALSMLGWRSPGEPVQRSRTEALRLAAALAERARQHPDRFPELATEYSEDQVTRAAGGSLGAVTATQLYAWPPILDALAATPIGAVSDVVETQFGFHIFWRRQLPAERTVSGARIVIGHVDAPFLTVASCQGPPTRSRADALALAWKVYDQARRWPDRFDQLVAEFSEHEDAARAGDFGTWSTREPTFMSRELQTLQALNVDDLAPPLDTAFGFQIIRRVPDRARERYAMAQVQLNFDPTATPGEPGSREDTLAQMQRWASDVATDPAQFDILRRTACCRDETWVEEGRESPAIEAALRALKVGGVTRQPIEANLRLLLVKRLPPTALPPPGATQFALPSPLVPDLFAVARSQSSTFWSERLQAVAARAAEILAPSRSGAAAELRALIEVVDWLQVHGADERVRSLQEIDGRLQRWLAVDEYDRYRHLLETSVEDRLMRQR